MIKMKDSGIPWIGQIPEDWVVAKYKFFANSGMGETILGGNLVEDGIPVYSATQNNTVFGYVKSSSLKLNKNDFVIPARGNSIGCVTIVKDNEATATQTTIYSKLNDKINYKFLYYCCVGLKDVWFYFEDTAIPQITVNQVQNNKVPLPPKEIQQKIVEILDKKCGQIDELVRIEENEIEKLKEYKTSLITKVVTKGLDPNAKMKDSGIPWIGQIPEDWKVVRLKNIAKCYGGLTYSPDDINEKGILVLRSSNIQNGKLSFNDNVYVKVNNFMPVEKNDILICSRNGSRELIGKNAIITTDIKATFGAFMMIIRTSQNAKYLHKILNSNIFNYYISSFLTSTINQLTKNNLDNIKFPFSIDPNTQQQIVEYLDKRCEEIDNLIKIKQEKIEKLKEYKKSLIYQYVTGKKEVV